MIIQFGQSIITHRQIEFVTQALTDNRVSRGRFTRRFEELLAELHGVKHAIFMASGTCALQCMLEAAKEYRGWPEGAEVIVPATTFIATVATVRQAGLTPVLCDVEPLTGNIDIGLFSLPWKNAVAVMPVHLLGRSANMSAIEDFKGWRLDILEDCCEAVGVSRNGQPVGSFGLAAAISTYVCHHVSTGVGGAVLTNNDDIATICRSLMQHGRDPNYLWLEDDDDLDDSQVAGMMRARYHFPRWGHSYRATEMEAAMGVGAMEGKWDISNDRLKRRLVAHDIGVALRKYDDRIASQVWHDGDSPLFYPLICDTPETCQGLSEAYERAGIETRPMMTLLDQPPILKMLAEQRRTVTDYPNALKLCTTSFLIACHSGMTSEAIEWIRLTTEAFFNRSAS
jgi:dTDP-4-amino-4,6-dideoxygalactose transaminase